MLLPRVGREWTNEKVNFLGRIKKVCGYQTQKQSHNGVKLIASVNPQENWCLFVFFVFFFTTGTAVTLILQFHQIQFSPKFDDWASGPTTWAQHNLPAINSHHSPSDPFSWTWRAWLCPQLHQYHRSYRRVSDLPTINIHTIYPEQWPSSRTPNSPFLFSTGH